MPNAGQIIKALDFPDAQSNAQGSNGTTTSVTFTPTLTGSDGASLTFVAPTSGRVVISNQCRLVNSAANETYCGFFVRTGSVVGSGTTVLASADERSIIHVGTSVHRNGNNHLLTGLTAGDTYNVQQEFRVSAGTGTYAYRLLVVTPTT